MFYIKCYNIRSTFQWKGCNNSMKQSERELVLKIIAAIVLFSVFSLYGCTGPEEKEQGIKDNKGFVKIAAILPLSGPKGYLGEEEKKAIELAVKEINIKKNREIIQVIFADSKENPAEAAIVAARLLNMDKVSAFITSTTSISRAALPIATNNKRLITVLCLDPTIQSMSPYAFRLYESMADEARQLVEYYSKTGKGKKVVILYLNHREIINQVTNYLIPEFMQEGIDVIYYEPYDLMEKDFKAKIDRLKLSGANSLMIVGFGYEYLPILKELAQQKLTGKIEITGGWGFLVSNKLPAEFVEGAIVASPRYVFQKNEKARLFEEKFTKTYGHAPNLDAAFAYDSVNIFAEGLIQGLIEKQGNADTVSFIITNHKYDGVMGEVSVDNEGGLIVPMGLGVIKQGKILPYNK